MNEYLIYKKCLSMFNIEISKSAFDERENENRATHEISLCNTWIESALLRALRESKWSFFTEPLEIEKHTSLLDAVRTQDQSEGDTLVASRTFYGYRNAYVIKSDIYEITDVIKDNDRRQKVNYRVYGDTLYTDDEDIVIVGIKKKGLEEYKGIPQEFEDMVAYALALLIAPSIAPKDLSIQNLINTQYSWALDKLRRLECNSNIRRTYHEELE